MMASSVPAKLPEPWAKSASGTAALVTNPMPDTVSGGTGLGSWSLGWQAINDTPIASGGIPPFMKDFNGVLFPVSGWAQWFSMGGPVVWDSAFSSTIGGYPKGAIVQSASVTGKLWLCTADNNTTNPDASGAGWTNLLSPNTSIGTNGHRQNPDGTIEQWGQATVPSVGAAQSTVGVTFPIPFPNAVLCLTGNALQGAQGTSFPPSFSSRSISTTAFTMVLDVLNPGTTFSNTVTANWRAFGW